MHLSLISSFFCTFTCDYSDHQKFKKYGCVNACFESTTRSITCSVRVRWSQDLDTDCLEADHAIQSFAHILRPSCPFIRDNGVQKMIVNIFVSLSNIRCTTPCYVTPHHSSHFQKKGSKEGSKLVPVGNVGQALNPRGNNSSLS